jgi:hypothetical protein
MAVAFRKEGMMRFQGNRFVVSVLALTVIVAMACQRSESPGAGSGSVASPTPDPHPPLGILDVPREDTAVQGGSWGYGWALDDSGIAAVTVSFDGGSGIPAQTGQAFPGVKEAYPNLPDNDKAGFIFGVPKLAAGPHSVIVTIVAKDGGRSELKRQFQIK